MMPRSDSIENRILAAREKRAQGKRA